MVFIFLMNSFAFTANRHAPIMGLWGGGGDSHPSKRKIIFHLFV